MTWKQWICPISVSEWLWHYCCTGNQYGVVWDSTVELLLTVSVSFIEQATLFGLPQKGSFVLVIFLLQDWAPLGWESSSLQQRMRHWLCISKWFEEQMAQFFLQLVAILCEFNAQCSINKKVHGKCEVQHLTTAISLFLHLSNSLSLLWSNW